VIRDGAADFHWDWYSHVDFDGIGALADVASRAGHDLRLPQLRIRKDKDATVLDYFRPFFRRSYLRAAPKSPWDRPTSEPATSTERHLPQHLIALSAAETREVALVARRFGVSINSLLLWGLADAMRGFAVRPGDRQHWTVPVNMRGGVGIGDAMANPLSFIRIPIRPGETPDVIHARIYDLLDTGMHWVMLRWIRFFANRRRMKFPPVRSTGAFSNLGSFSAPGIDRVITCPPTGPTEPLAACVVTWNGQMTLALSVHHSMNPPAGAIDAVGERWRNAMLTGSTMMVATQQAA
jgi:hypothetical protein